MNQSIEKGYSCRGSECIGQFRPCGQKPTGSGLSRFFSSVDGRMELEIPEGVLPGFLIEAYNAVDGGRVDEAIKLVDKQAIETVCQMAEDNPSDGEVLYLLLAMIFQKAGAIDKAEGWYKKALANEPHALVLNEAARFYQSIGRLSQALEYRRKAVEAEPDNAAILSNFASDLMQTGRTQEGIELLRKAAAGAPDNAVIGSMLLCYLHYLPEMEPQMLFEEHKRWGRAHAPVSLGRESHDNEPAPARRLRVGYISPDFCTHSVAYFFEPVLDGCDHDAVEIYGYGSVAKPDGATERLKSKFDHYRNIRGLEDKKVARLIERDRIDVLVSLGGHMRDNRLGVLAYKPAPIQVDFWGLNTSGMEQIDYRLTDKLLDPGHLEEFYVEESVYLPDGVLCYRPVDFAPAVAPLPAIENGYVTFGSFNNSLKVNSYIVSLWAEILKAKQESRFLMKFKGGDDEGMKEHYLHQFERLGISRDRIQIFGWKSPVEHLGLYNQVDIAFDSYPYNGTTTICEGLWMGVPTLSLVGEGSLLSRAGLSVLSRVGLEIFSASTAKEYVDKAVAFASEVENLATIRASLRMMMLGSTLCNAKNFALQLESAYRKMWHRWCRSGVVETS